MDEKNARPRQVRAKKGNTYTEMGVVCNRVCERRECVARAACVVDPGVEAACEIPCPSGGCFFSW